MHRVNSGGNINPSVQNKYANYSVEELGTGAARPRGSDMAVSNKRTIAEIARCLSAAVHKPPSKWTVVVASILAVALHAGPVVWVEMQQRKPTLTADAPVLIHSVKEVFETGTGTDTAGAGGAKNAAD